MDKVIKEYIGVFGELPPADAVISYYDNFYQDLMKKAIKSGKKITAETLPQIISVLREKGYEFKNFYGIIK